MIVPSVRAGSATAVKNANRRTDTALERGRWELRQAVQARLLTLADKAADCLEVTLAQGDGKAALALLKGLGLLNGPGG